MPNRKPICALLLAAPLLLTGCGTSKEIPIVDLAPPVLAPPRPAPPEGAFAAITLPARGADGAYVTPNQGLGPQGMIWHVRAALNVAALRCPDDIAKPLAVRYNVLLKTQKTVFTQAYTAVRGLYQKNDPKAWQTDFDQDQTRLYNFFSQSGGKAGFCASAADVSSKAESVDPKSFADFARAALADLDKPFTAFYEAYASYQDAANAWDKQYGAAPPTSASAPKPDVTASIN